MTSTCEAPPLRLLPRDETPIRLAVSGLGKMGAAHLRAARELRDGGAEPYYKGGLSTQVMRLRIRGVCDPIPGTPQLADGTPWYRSWTELLEAERPHIAVIASPTRFHEEQARACLEAGVHTLVEKPLAPGLASCRELTELAGRTGCRLLAGHVERYNPVSIKLKSWLTRSPPVRYYRFERSQALPDRIPEDILTDKLIHDLDLALSFFGPVTDTQVDSRTEQAGRIVEASVRLRHASGTEGALFVSWLRADRHPVRTLALLGGSGERIQGDFLNKTLIRDEEPVLCGVPGWVNRQNNQIKDQLTDFIATCLEPGEDTSPPLLTQQEILEAMRILEHIRSQAHHV